MEYWRKNLSYKTKVFFFYISPRLPLALPRWGNVEELWDAGEVRNPWWEGACSYAHQYTGSERWSFFFFLFLLLCPRNTTLPVSFRIKYWATMQPCMHECDLPGCALDDHWLREMKKDSCAFPVVKTWLLAYPHMRFCGRLLRTWLQTHQLTPLLLDGRWCKWRRVFW